MKKLLYISLILIVGCTKPELPTPTMPIEKIFTVNESKVINGQSLYFDLPSAGVYTLTLIDKQSEQVVSRERFTGQNGENVKKIYTNSLSKGYLYLVLKDANNTEINRTTIIIN
jgi:hypothetical protein